MGDWLSRLLRGLELFSVGFRQVVSRKVLRLGNGSRSIVQSLLIGALSGTCHIALVTSGTGGVGDISFGDLS